MCFRNLFIACSAFIVSSFVFANPGARPKDVIPTPSTPSNLTPGAKLLTEEPIPGEFLVIGQGEEMQIKPVFKPNVQRNKIEKNQFQAVVKSPKDLRRPTMQPMEALKRPAMPVNIPGYKNIVPAEVDKYKQVIPIEKAKNQHVVPAENTSPKKATPSHASKKKIAKIKIALHKTMHRMASIKTKAPIKITMHQTHAKKSKVKKVPHQLVSKRKVTKATVKMGLNKSRHPSKHRKHTIKV